MEDGFEGCMVDAGEGRVKPGAMNLNFMSWDVPGGTFYNGMPPRKMANLWGLLYNKTAIRAMQSARPDRRIFGLSRAATAGSQRHSLIWSGDHSSTWEEFERELSSGLNMSMSGLPFWTYDIGGIEGMPSKELFTRWFQAACFIPVMRTHGRFSREPWLYGKFVEEQCRRYLALRMRLVPYLYSLAYEMHADAQPMVRPLCWLYPEDKRAAGVWDQWMLGDALMACPVHRAGCVSRQVYLPQGRWLDMNTGELLEGGRTIAADAPLDTIPYYLREGAILPWGEPMQYVDEKKPERLLLRIFPGETPSSFSLYEDDGLTQEYRQGAFTLRTFTAVREGRTVSIRCETAAAGYRDAFRRFSFELTGCEDCRVLYNGRETDCALRGGTLCFEMEKGGARA